MTKEKNTKRALFTSVLSMMLCMAMLIGTTFAWFTDSVTSKSNKIIAGNLDVQLLMKTSADGDYENITEESDPIFGYGSIAQNNNAETLWEPGKTQVAYLAIKNNGNLALKYKVNLDVQNVSKNLYEVMQYDITPDAQYGDVTSWAGNGKNVVSGTQMVSDSADVFLDAGKTHYFALSVHMKEEAGNDYMGGEVNFDLTVFATQASYEKDSFDDQYDADAKLPDVVVSNSVDLEAAMSKADGNIIALRGGTYNMGSKMVTYTGKEFTLIAMDDEEVTINGELAFNGSSKVSIHNINIYAENGPMLIEGDAEFNMHGGSLTSGGYYAALITNGGKTRGAKVTLDGVHLIAKRANGTDGCAIYAPGQADYTLKDCVVDGYAVFCAGNVVIEGGSVTYNKSFAINGNAYNTNATDTHDGKQYFDREEALAGLKKVTSGALGLGDALQFDCNRGSGYEKLERVEIRNTKITATSTQDTEYVFGIRYIESCVEGDTHVTEFVLENIDTTTYNLPSK